MVVLKWSQTLQPSPQPHLHKLHSLLLSRPASGPAINTFSIKTTGKHRGRWRRKRRRRTEESFCLRQRRVRPTAPALACSLITGWFFATSQAFNAAGLESRSAPANTLMEHLRWNKSFTGYSATWTQHKWRVVGPGYGAWTSLGLQTYQCLWRLLQVAVVKLIKSFVSATGWKGDIGAHVNHSGQDFCTFSICLEVSL